MTVNLASQTLEPIGHVAFRHFLERGRGMPPFRHGGYNGLCARMLDRINSVIRQGPRGAGLLPSFDEAHIGECAEPHIARSAVQPKAEDPGPCSARPGLQIETGAVVMQADLG